jgi:hypothetical protein
VRSALQRTQIPARPRGVRLAMESTSLAEAP